jgi:hypothetical protein
MELGLSYLYSVHFPVSVLISLVFAYQFGSMRSKGSTEMDLSRLNNLSYLSVYTVSALVISNLAYIVSAMFLDQVLAFYALIPGLVGGYMISRRMSAGSSHVSLNRLDSLSWFATWSLAATAVTYIVLFFGGRAVELV